MSTGLLQPIAPTPIDRSLPRLDRLVSPLTGIVRRLYEPLHSATEPSLVRVAAEATAGSALLGTPLDDAREGTGGSGLTRAAARAAAIGEAVERYAASYVPEGSLVRATARERGHRAAPPDSFALFSPAQYVRKSFPFNAFTSETRVWWTEGFGLPDGKPVDLPAQLVYLRDRRGALDESPIGYATSNGLACAPTLEEAVLNGLLEVLERDAFLMTWYARLSLPRLDWSGHDRLLELDRRYFTGTRLSYAVVDLSGLHGVPTVVATVRGRRPCAAFAVGAACQPTIEEAWRKALAEAFSVEAWARTLLRTAPDRDLGLNFEEVRTFADHVQFYADERRARRSAFLDGSDRTRAAAEVEPLEGGDVLAQIEALTRRVERAGQRAYAVDVTSPDVRSAGLRVAKVVVPGFCQLDADYRYRFLGCDRPLAAAMRLGLRESALSRAELNDDPHPFP